MQLDRLLDPNQHPCARLFLMKCGILIIGSLYWENENGRDDWRRRRLDMNASIPVRAPIYFGRKSASRGNTYTMTFRRNDPSGVAILVPCQSEIQTIDDLKDEVEALWKAEAPNSRLGAIDSDWDCVGALLGSDEAREALVSAWSTHFRTCRTAGCSVVGADALAQHVEVADHDARVMKSESKLLRTLVATSPVEKAAFGG